MSTEIASWPRVRELLDNIMARWERKEGRKGLPGIHSYSWATPQELAKRRIDGIQVRTAGHSRRGDRANNLPAKGIRIHPPYAHGRPVP